MILDTLLQTIQRHHLLPPDSTIVLAVSGGTDSLAMLHAFTQLPTTLRCELHVATFNHGLRASAAADVIFVQNIAQKWGIPCTTGYEDVRRIAQNTGKNLEAAARESRYQFLAQVAHQINAAYIVTAHHANDQAETILMHILRGAGSAGLQGMAYKMPLPQAPDIWLLRPMLDIARLELETYCQQHALQPRNDETNQDTSLLRNAIRLEILPQLAHINPQIHQALSRLGAVVRVEQDFIQKQYEQIVLPHLIVHQNRIELPHDIFQGLHPALRRHWLIDAVRMIQGNTDELSYERIQAALAIAAKTEVGAVAQLPHQLEVIITYNHIVVRRANIPDIPENFLRLTTPDAIPVIVPGITLIENNWQLHATTEPNTPESYQLFVPPNAAITLRTRRPGDIFAPAGLKGQRQKLKKWFIDHKIPYAVRDTLPLLIVNEIIAALLLPRWILSDTFIHAQHGWNEINFVIVIKDE